MFLYNVCQLKLVIVISNTIDYYLIVNFLLSTASVVQHLLPGFFGICGLVILVPSVGCIV